MIPYIQETSFVVRSFHDALRCTMTIADPHGLLAPCLLSLSNLDFTVTYLTVLVNRVPDALSTCTL